MCLGNRAVTSAYYINQQLESLWKISNECVEKHGYGLKPSRIEVEYGTCLSQICVGKHNRAKPAVEDLEFFASFGGPPQLKFICNHEAILYLKLKRGHFRVEGRGIIEQFDDYTCALRVQFREHLITDVSYSTFGQTEACKMKLVVLDLNNATFLYEFSEFAQGHNLTSEGVDRKHKSIVHHLSLHYLPLLRKAGVHCIYSLPDFDSLSRIHHIDYSVVSEIDIKSFDLFGIKVDSINTFLKGRWLEAAAYIDELEDDHDHSLFGKFALAEHRCSYEDISFHAFFGVPHIRPLCSKEVIFYIDVQDLHFYLDGDFRREPHHKFSDWKIAVVVDVVLVEEDEGCVRRLKLDFSKARFCESRTICGFGGIEEKIFLKLRTIFIQYITQRYFVILEQFRHSFIYQIDTRVVEIEEDYFVEEEEYIEFSESYGFQEQLCVTETFGFDSITTIAQGSVNDHLRNLWRAAQSAGTSLVSWEFEEFFGASFGAPQIQFPCNPTSNTVILYLHMRDGFLTTLGHHKRCIGGEKHEFSSWKLAFEVTLNFREYSKDHIISSHFLGGRGGYILKQLVLDFSTAKFRQDLSRLPNLFDGLNYRLMRLKREALLYYITHFYFPLLKHDGHHVLYSIPIWNTGDSELHHFASSSLNFQFYPSPFGESGSVISALFGPHRNHGNRNMLVICGMFNNTRRPSFPLPICSWNWVPGKERYSGSIVLSRSAFLNRWLLPNLARINGRTTIVPIFNGIGMGGEWGLKIVRWEQHECNFQRSCEWNQIENCEDGLQFEWRNLDEWTYLHKGDECDDQNGYYTVSCTTVNKLVLPTVSHHGACEIRLNGKVELKLTFKGGKKSWSSSAVAKWTAGISLGRGSNGSGIAITQFGTSGISDSSGFIGDFEMVHPQCRDASTLLKEQFSTMELLESSIIENLKADFAGVWPLFYSGAYGYMLCNPVFNKSGDLIFDLESPLDRHGRIVVSSRERRDFWLPKRRYKISYDGIISESSINLESSMLTSSTGADSPLKTPPLGQSSPQHRDLHVMRHKTFHESSISESSMTLVDNVMLTTSLDADNPVKMPPLELQPPQLRDLPMM